MEYIVRSMRFFLSVMYLSVLPAAYAAMPDAAPGKTLGSPLLQRDTMNQLFSSDRIAASECQSRKIVNMEVLEQTKDPQFVAGQMVAGEWKERWYIDRCGKIIPYDVQYSADGKGGTFISFLIGGATETAKTATSESNGLNEYLIKAALLGDSVAVKKLLAVGANANHKGWNDITPLFRAIVSGKVEIIKMLLEHGADVNARTKPNVIGETPLMWAASQGNSEIVQFLMRNGADAKARGSDGKTVLGSINYWCLSADALKDLIEHGEYNQVDISMAFLVGSSIKTDCANQKSFLDYAKFFMDNGADVNAKSKYGDTALIMASRWGYPDAVRYLLSKGADFSIKSDEGDTALKVAKTSEIRQLLKDAKR